MSFCADFEDHLISPDKWDELYPQMPVKCRELVDRMRIDPMSEGGPVSIGKSDELGWFIACSGQGPFIAWAEKDVHEGDIVTHVSGRIGNGKYGEVILDHDKELMVLDDEGVPNYPVAGKEDELTVVGNVQDNSELLKGKT